VIKLRLRRMGAKRQPSYRIVAAESRSPRDGRFIEIVGFYNPKTDPYELRVNAERAKYWLDHGAQPTETVRSLLVKSGVLPGRDGQVAAQPPAQQAAKPAEPEPVAEEPEPEVPAAAEEKAEADVEDEPAVAAENEDETEESEKA
jgi:small subunit ribosomal protein S16